MNVCTTSIPTIATITTTNNTTITVYRFKYERGIAMHGYGLLLSSWDKRATAGSEMSQRAEDQLASLPGISLPTAVSTASTLRIPLNTMIQWTL